jgi:hypothetical protein
MMLVAIILGESGRGVAGSEDLNLFPIFRFSDGFQLILSYFIGLAVCNAMCDLNRTGPRCTVG